MGHFVIGAEADVSASDIKKTTTVSPIVQNNGTPFPGAGFISATQKIKYMGTVRPRAGVAFNRLFVYGTAGLAYGRVNYSANTDFRPFGTVQYPSSFSKTQTGWTAGAGAEVAINKHFSVKAEYLYYDLGKVTSTVSATPALPPYQMQYTWETKGSTFKTGVNFRF
jgi:outer membrane immunogenic protein